MQKKVIRICKVMRICSKAKELRLFRMCKVMKICKVTIYFAFFFKKCNKLTKKGKKERKKDDIDDDVAQCSYFLEHPQQ